MRVRDAEVGDAQALGLVHVRSWQAAYRGLMPQVYLDGLDVDQRAQGWRRRLEGLELLYPTRVLDDGKDGVIGFVSSGPSREGDSDPALVGQIFALYLLPSHWGRGGGRSLLDDAVHRLKDEGRQRATLWVLETNARARRFYEAQGWAADGQRMTDTGFGFPIEEVRYGRSL